MGDYFVIFVLCWDLLLVWFWFFEGGIMSGFVVFFSLGNPAKDEFNGNAPQKALCPLWADIKASHASPLGFLIGVDAQTQVLRCVACSQIRGSLHNFNVSQLFKA